MTTLTVKQRILGQTTGLQEQLEQKKPVFDSLSPSEQLSNANQFIPHSKLLTELQKKVEATYRRQQDAIPDITEEELLGIAEKLTACADILESLDKNNQIAEEYVDIASAVDKLYQSSTPPNASAIKSLQGRIQELKSADDSYMNRGNREALDIANQNLESMLTQSSTLQTTQTPSIQTSSPRQSPLTTISEDREIQRATDEDYLLSLFEDQLKDIREKCTEDPRTNFELVLAHYNEVKRHAPYTPETAGPAIATHLEALENILNRCIEAQTEKESEQTQQVQGQATQVEVLKELIHVIGEAIGSSNIPAQLSNIDGIFSRLSLNEKQKLFEALNEIQKTKSNRDMGQTVMGRRTVDQLFSSWPAGWGHKKEALEKILSSSNDPIPPVVTVVKQAEEMKRRLKEAKKMQAVVSSPSPTRSDPTRRRDPSPSAPSDLPPELYLPDDIDISTLDFEDVAPAQEEVPVVSTHPSIETIHTLQALLILLGPDADDAQLQEAYAALQTMDSRQLQSVFKMTDVNPRAIADRPFFHLYFIHKNEAPEKLRGDGQYGNKAFAGTYPATNEERSRSVQRTIVELALECLEDAINFEDGATVIALLDSLEATKLGPKDRAQGEQNATHNLYGAFYHLHAAARTSNSSLVDPNDYSKFQGDFGRKAFRASMEGVDAAIKIAAIHQVRNALKAAWKL